MNRPEGGYAGYLARAAEHWPSRAALRFEGSTWTYGELDRAVNRVADCLAAKGISERDRVALLIENRPEYLIAQFAIARLGAAFVTPNPHWTEPELTRALAAAAVTAAVHGERFDGLADALSTGIRADSLFTAASQRAPDPAAAPDTLRYIPFSSGTTGLPKGVLHTDASLCGGVEQLRAHLSLSADDRVPIGLPLCHIFGATMCAAAFAVGAELTLFTRFDLDTMLRHIAAGNATVLPIAGTVAHQLAERKDLRPQDFAAVRYFMWGGSGVPAALADRITTRTGIRFLCSYGMTEAMMVAFNPVHNQQDWRLDSPGYPTMGTEIRLTPAGELEVRGPSVAAGYAGREAPEFGPDGWFRTGDVATVDDNGRLHIVDRAKDMVKVSGFQVAPAEVEAALLEHPAVDDAGVTGRPDDRTGEAVVAFIVTSTAVTRDALTDWLRGRLASYKRPREFHFVTELPRTASGKLRRGELLAPDVGCQFE
ncbi:class I adenylate-forming enzyme family protein [Mycobacterium sp. 050134]|uniref:class I adenylate-forming enzyme family protein n=1 Tax=Mycobacterium sp. 050134 TaxID=3096111 RepID=UPI002EDBB394